MDYLISDKRSNRRAASGDRVRGRGGGGLSLQSHWLSAPPPPFQVPSVSLKIWIFPSLPFSLPSSYKKTQIRKKLVSDVVFSLFFFFFGGGGGGQENNHLCILNLEFHIGAFMAPKL